MVLTPAEAIDTVTATVRFSNGSGNPGQSDYAPDPRGLAVKLSLPDGSRTDIVAVSTPVFPTRTPEGFIEPVLNFRPRAYSESVARRTKGDTP